MRRILQWVCLEVKSGFLSPGVVGPREQKYRLFWETFPFTPHWRILGFTKPTKKDAEKDGLVFSYIGWWKNREADQTNASQKEWLEGVRCPL